MVDHQQQQHDPSSLTNNNNPSRPLKKIIAVSSIAAGVQFGWALQLSLLTPYVQLLGIPHKWAAFIWLCGPVSGMIVQPIVGYQSDRCLSKYGRRRPFIAAGSALVIIAVLCISFAADLGRRFGDQLGSSKSKPRAIIIFVIGFWILDVANNMLQGPCRAFLADLSGKSPRTTRKANACYSFFMAVGNVLGYAAGSITSLYKIVPFTKTEACDIYCANLKACFFISVVLLIILTTIVLTTVHDEVIIPSVLVVASNNNGDNGHHHEITRDLSSSSSGVESGGDVRRALMNLKKPMWMLLLVTCLNWVAWFPFLLFDTDWMGKEVYGGKVGEGNLYGIGVREGALGLMLNSIVLGFMSLWVEFLGRKMGGVKRLWGCVNFVLAVCLGLTVLITKLAESSRSSGSEEALPPVGIKVSALALFAVLGIPLAVTYSIPFALASIFSNSSGAGQGLSLGVLNLAIVLPQILVSMASGPWDALFGGGNTPAFVAGAVAAAASGILALTMLPSPPPDHIPSTATNTSSSTAIKTRIIL